MTAASVKDLLTRVPYAHRGTFDNKLIPENSLSAFRASLANGFGIELDVMLSADGVVMVFHDDDLKRLGGQQGEIKKHSARELGEIHLLNTDQTVPTLIEVLALVAGQVPLMIELKSFHPNGFDSTGLLESAVLNAVKDYPGLFALKSFNPMSVMTLLELSRAKTTPVGQRPAVGFLSCNYANDADLQFVDSALALEHSELRSPAAQAADFFSYSLTDLTPELSEFARKQKPLLVWTVRTEAQHQKASQLADNFIFEWRGIGSRTEPRRQG